MIETLDLSLADLNHRLLDAVDAIDSALSEYRVCNSRWVEAERDHRHARAVKMPRLKERLAADRENELYLLTEEEWLKAEQCKALRDTAKEALRATMAILNGLQSVARAHSEEARLSMYGEQRSA